MPPPDNQDERINQLPVEMSSFFSLLSPEPIPQITEQVRARMQQTQEALIVLGPAGGAVTVCPGNQDTPEFLNSAAARGLSVSEIRCPLFTKCDLAKNRMAPAGHLCPYERDYVLQRFAAWCEQIGKNPNNITEVERVTVSELTWIDLQELRCSTILSSGEDARLSQLSVKEVNPTNGAYLAWEKMIHVNAQLLDQLLTRRRLILKDWELTPEMQTRKRKVDGKGKGLDLSSQTSARADRLRNLPPVIEAS